MALYLYSRTISCKNIDKLYKSRKRITILVNLFEGDYIYALWDGVRKQCAALNIDLIVIAGAELNVAQSA